MVDYKTDVPWNLDMARKNVTRAVGYLRRIGESSEINKVEAEASALEQKIVKLIDELGEEAMENA